MTEFEQALFANGFNEKDLTRIKMVIENAQATESKATLSYDLLLSEELKYLRSAFL
ncbi:hypothetical protein ACGVWS_14435 [Enterobacteriaceae bacterium LUAb1]